MRVAAAQTSKATRLPDSKHLHSRCTVQLARVLQRRLAIRRVNNRSHTEEEEEEEAIKRRTRRKEKILRSRSL